MKTRSLYFSDPPQIVRVRITGFWRSCMLCGMTAADVVIRPLSASDSLECLTDLLHRAYAVRLEEGFRFTATHQSVQVTKDRVTKGQCFVAADGDRLVGTATIRPPNKEDRVEIYRRAWGFGQFGLLPEFRGRGIGRLLYQACEEHATANGATLIGLDTPDAATHLIEMYLAWGFEVVGEIDYDFTNYNSVVMGKRLGD